MKLQQNHRSFSYWVYRIVRWLVWLFYPRITVEGQENLPDEPCIIVGNHSQMNGPIIGQLYFPNNPRIWCASQMMRIQEVPQYAYEDFWRDKPRLIRWFYKVLSYVIAPLCACIFTNADTIAVYRDSRLINTFKQTIQTLEDGTNVIIFPECRQEHNCIINQFQTHFIDIAKLYYKRTGKKLSFVPLYIAPKLRKIYIGKPVVFDADQAVDEERLRICRYLMDTITAIAMNLPRHRVVPYSNIAKHAYPWNKEKEDSSYETGNR